MKNFSGFLLIFKFNFIVIISTKIDLNFKLNICDKEIYSSLTPDQVLLTWSIPSHLCSEKASLQFKFIDTDSINEKKNFKFSVPLNNGKVKLNNVSLYFQLFQPIKIEWRVVNSACTNFVNDGVELFRNRGKRISHTYFFKAFNWELQPTTEKEHGKKYAKIRIPLISKYYSDKDSEKVFKGFLKAYHLTINKFADCPRCHKKMHKRISVVNDKEYERICFSLDEWTKYNERRYTHPVFHYNETNSKLIREIKKTAAQKGIDDFILDIKNHWPNSLMNLTLRAVTTEGIAKLGMNFEKFPMLAPTRDFDFNVIKAIPGLLNITIKNPSDYRGLAGYLYFNIDNHSKLNVINFKLNPYMHRGWYVIRDNRLRANGEYNITGYPTTQPYDQLELLVGEKIEKKFSIRDL
ncbi:DgyrCDS8116 [Dimorphilus gyrociliatus]|uniref:DgyrCDS8116 n=1 Tax=Dimorphilus gyrociliatus TaxID=2664684 RepID=A0A7I8VT86_9ANNE|nr:DgyrCDS8116 [Dimorphilus gyrociliatus]